MLFWISRLFSLRMEQFSVSWFDGTDDQSQIVHGLPERTYSSSIQTYWSTIKAALMPFHRRVIALPLLEFTSTGRNIQFLLWLYGWMTTVHLLFNRGPSCSTRQDRVFSTSRELVWTPGITPDYFPFFISWLVMIWFWFRILWWFLILWDCIFPNWLFHFWCIYEVFLNKTPRKVFDT